ncbi:MAG: tRNA pseudouridine(55) synthase TruB [Deltaproteobacteria bacterium]|nr:MAG: tRNA pseudouridine(55) synthase TruB [Deltaproteobacteria bacterium]
MIQKDGIIIVDKESGPSSFRVVRRIKDLLRVKKAGHAGTLDPFATGVLVVLLNQATKLFPFLMSQDKVYKAALRLGIEKDTQDLTGRIVKEKDIGGLTREVIEHRKLQFLGRIKQAPPPYSAVHHHGRRAYELARGGLEVDLQERDVRVDYINILSVDLPTVWIEVGCSSGTYIRTLAADLGRSLGTGAHLTSLRRIKSGPFLVDNAFTLPQIAQHLSDDTVDEMIISLKDALKGMMEVEIPNTLARKIRNGYSPHRGELSWEDIPSFNPGDYLKVVMGEELVAILRAAGNGYEIDRVFA